MNDKDRLVRQGLTVGLKTCAAAATYRTLMSANTGGFNGGLLEKLVYFGCGLIVASIVPDDIGDRFVDSIDKAAVIEVI